MQISTHAPMKGATQNLLRRGLRLEISTHAPMKGATSGRRNSGKASADFNSRSHEGSDIDCGILHIKATNFNSRSHEGSDTYIPPKSTKLRNSLHIMTNHISLIPSLKLTKNKVFWCEPPSRMLFDCGSHYTISTSSIAYSGLLP